MDIETLEELRLLSNINLSNNVMLQLILVGQPELVDKLNLPELAQFAQRVSIEYHLKPLNYDETKNYIAHRIEAAGGRASVFNESACAAVFYYTEGVPRLINNICDLAMVFAFATDTHEIGWKTILEVVNERKTSGIHQFTETVPPDLGLSEHIAEAEKFHRAVLEKTGFDTSACL
jgi:type II secretory pathway predicted ATPase ExeA